VILLPESEADLPIFLADHAQVHRLLAAAAAVRGAQVPDYDFSTLPNADWHLAHAQAHDALARAARVESSAGLTEGWYDEKSFHDWAALNANDHAIFSDAYGF